MKKISIVLISVVIIFGFASSNHLFAEDIKLNKKSNGKEFKIHELINQSYKIDYEKNLVTVFKIENTEMSKGSATWLGIGAGLVVGAGAGYLVGYAINPDGGEDQEWSELFGVVIGGISGAVVGGIVGHKLGK